MLNLGQKNRILEAVIIEPMRDFIRNALQEDPAMRYGVDDLLNHEFLTQAPRKQNTTCEVQYTNGMYELHREQER